MVKAPQLERIASQKRRPRPFGVCSQTLWRRGLNASEFQAVRYNRLNQRSTPRGRYAVRIDPVSGREARVSSFKRLCRAFGVHTHFQRQTLHPQYPDSRLQARRCPLRSGASGPHPARRSGKSRHKSTRHLCLIAKHLITFPSSLALAAATALALPDKTEVRPPRILSVIWPYFSRLPQRSVHMPTA